MAIPWSRLHAPHVSVVSSDDKRKEDNVIRVINLIGWPLNRPLIWLHEHTSKCVGCGRRCDGRCALW